MAGTSFPALSLAAAACVILTASGAHAQPAADIRPTHVVELRDPPKKGQKQPEAEPVACVAFAPDGKTAYFGGGHAFGPGLLACVEVKTGKAVWATADHKLNVHCVAVRPDGKRIVTGGGYREVKVWDQDGKLLHSLTTDWQHTRQVVFSPDGKWLACSGDWLNVFDAGKFERVHDDAKGPFGMLGAFTKDSKSLIGSTAATPGAIQFMTVGDWKTTEYKAKVQDLQCYHPALSEDGTMLAVGTLRFRRDADCIYGTEVWAVKGGQLGEKLAAIPGSGLGCAFTPDGKYLLLGEAELERANRIRVLEAATGKEVGAWVAAGKASVISSLAVSPDGKTLASCAGHAGKLWDLEAILAGFNEGKRDRK